MIVVRQKPIDEIRAMVTRHHRVLLVGCNTCAAVALAGGEKEVDTMVEYLRLSASRHGSQVEFSGAVLTRQCEPEYLAQLDSVGYDAILSLGCGAGVALLASTAGIAVYPGLDTLFIGASYGPASWEAECSACWKCVLGRTAGICPMTRCAKGILNGPCGGVAEGRCELGDRDCAWVLIHDRLDGFGRSEESREIAAPKDHSVRTSLPGWSAHSEGKRP